MSHHRTDRDFRCRGRGAGGRRPQASGNGHIERASANGFFTILPLRRSGTRQTFSSWHVARYDDNR